jgi:hypothetical protein
MRSGEVPVAVLRTRSTRVDVWEPRKAVTLMAEVERTIREFRPQVLLTYGGDAVARAIIELGKRHGLAVVFGLHNFAYQDRELFRDVDRVIVPSEFSRLWYRDRLGLECGVLPYVIDWERVCVRGQESEVTSQGETLTPGAPGLRSSALSPQTGRGSCILVLHPQLSTLNATSRS